MLNFVCIGRKSDKVRRMEPPHMLKWVDQFMREIQDRYLFYDLVNTELYPIMFIDEENYQEVCFKADNGIFTITNEHTFHDLDSARTAALYIATNMNIDPTTWGNAQFDYVKNAPIQVLAFRHKDEHQFTGPAYKIEKHVTVNRVGFGVFVRKNLLENTNNMEMNNSA